MNKDTFTEKRFLELSRQAYERNHPVFSDFLTLGEISLLRQEEHRLDSRYCLFGGYEDSERQMAAFLPDAFSLEEKELKTLSFFPIQVLHFRPKKERFAEALTHRDILGALMHLGFGREKLGDILLQKTDVYIFAEKDISEFILENLRQIRKTFVYGEITSEYEVLTKTTVLKSATISSNRLDSVVSAMTGEPRGRAQELIKSGLVFVDGISETYTTKEVLPGKIVSVRGFGKFRFNKEAGETKKGRVKITFEKYV